jgi:hypothetical protein
MSSKDVMRTPLDERLPAPGEGAAIRRYAPLCPITL